MNWGLGIDHAKGKKTQRGRPPMKPTPEPIPDNPENIARAILTTPPKKEGDWEYKKEGRD